MKKYRIYRDDKYIYIYSEDGKYVWTGLAKNVQIIKNTEIAGQYKILGIRGWGCEVTIKIFQILKEDGTNYSLQEWENWIGLNIGDIPCTNSPISINGVYKSDLAGGQPLNIITTDQNDVPIVPISGTVSGGVATVKVNQLVFRDGETSMVMKTNASTSYQTGDDGDLKIGRNVDFFTLSNDNPFGNRSRFTGTTGGYHDRMSDTYKDVNGATVIKAVAFPNFIIIDWSTFNSFNGRVVGFSMALSLVISFSDAITYCNTFTVGSFTSGWHLPNTNELSLIRNYDRSDLLDYKPIESSTFQALWTSTTVPSNTTTALLHYSDGRIILQSKSIAAGKALPFRIFTVTGTTLT